ncbi:transcription antitermination factor NusB [Bdellovibrionota bacterium FG-2]
MATPKVYPRETAHVVLQRVLQDGVTLDQALELFFSQQDFSRTDRAWLLDVCAGVLRWRGRLDLAIDSIALKKRPTGFVRKALIIAAYQLIAQERTSPGAAVSETVSWVRKKEGTFPANFTNAVLRKLSAHAAEWRTLSAPPEGDPKAYQWASLPQWFWDRIVKERGWAWACAFAVASLERPKVWVRARNPHEVFEGADPGDLEGSFLLNVGENPTSLPGFDEGRWLVQDISSQRLIAELTLCLQQRGLHGARILDLCAAPGGKSVGMAWNGFSVFATDRADAVERMALLKQTVERSAQKDSGARIEVFSRAEVVAHVSKQGSGFDVVWVDAPCSGSGIVRRHPDIRWLKKESDLKGLSDVQQSLLKEAWGFLRPGGFLMYSVCSVLEQEGGGAVSKALPKAEIVKQWKLDPQNAPFGDGFSAVLLKKAN